MRIARLPRALAGLALALAACSSSRGDVASEQQLLPGFHPPAPRGNEIRLDAPLVRGVAPGADVTWCTYVKNPFDREVDVVQSRGYQSKFGHHALLMEVPGAEDRLGQSHECTDRDMTNARYLAGGSDGVGEFKIPEGVAFRIRPASVLMVQTHWINPSSDPVDGQTVFNIGAHPPDGKRQSAQLFAAFTSQVEVGPRAKGHASTECVIQSDIQFFTIGGHAHEWGTHVRLTIKRGGANEVLYDQPWEPHFQADPPLLSYEATKPLVLRKGDVLRVDCDYANTTNDELRFPREMCVGMGFYFPGDSDIKCADGWWIKG
jgi:hypothetical protein